MHQEAPENQPITNVKKEYTFYKAIDIRDKCLLYIGITTNLKQRIASHLSSRVEKSLFHDYIQSAGKDNIQFIGFAKSTAPKRVIEGIENSLISLFGTPFNVIGQEWRNPTLIRAPTGLCNALQTVG